MSSFDTNIALYEEVIDSEDEQGSEKDEECEISSKKARKGGRIDGSKSAVWQHFTYTSGGNASVCNYCNRSVPGKHPEPSEKHERRGSSECIRRSKRKLTRNASKWQATLPTLFAKKNLYDKGGKRYLELVNALALLFASQSLPHLLVESPEFRYFVSLLDPKFEPPKRQQLASIIGELFSKLKQLILPELRGIKMCVILDIWNRRGLSESYLGVLVQYFDQKSSKIKKALIALRKMEGPHTGENINMMTQSILAEWGILEENVLYYITDNGSNVIKALEEYVIDLAVGELELENCDEDEFERGEEGDIDANLENSFVETVNNDVQEFESSEKDHNDVFSYSKRIPCIAHQIACIVRKVVDGSAVLRPTLLAAYRLIKKISKSGQNKELLLVYNNGKALLSPSNTRWMFTYHVLHRLLESKEAVEQVVVEKNLSNVSLDALKWKNIEQLKALLQPFADAVRELEGDSYCTLSKVIPTIIDLIEQLSRSGIGMIGSTRKALKEELEKRFACIFDCSRAEFAPAHLLATFFDPQFVTGLSIDQRNKCIDIIVNDLATGANENVARSAGTFLDVSAAVSELAQKKYSGFFKRAQSIQIQTSVTASDQKRLIKAKLDSYINEVVAGGGPSSASVDAIAFWAAKKDTFAEIAAYTLDILCIPASSAGIERVFSLASIVQGGRRFRLGAQSTERELMIKVNRGFLIPG